MTDPNRGSTTITTASLERSLRNCSLNHHHHHHHQIINDGCPPPGFVAGCLTDVPSITHSDSSIPINLPPENTTLELNSQIRLPYYWEQCLDLKTGEVYYINWRTGMKSQEDPRTNPEMVQDSAMMVNGHQGLLQEQAGLSIWSEEEEEEDDSWWYESEGSSTEENSAPSTSSRRHDQQQCSRRRHRQRQHSPPTSASNIRIEQQYRPEPGSSQEVLVVGGCKTCFMYFMLPKQVQDCPKCFGQLLHFDRSDHDSP